LVILTYSESGLSLLTKEALFFDYSFTGAERSVSIICNVV
jgi:hypothetical protein